MGQFSIQIFKQVSAKAVVCIVLKGGGEAVGSFWLLKGLLH